MDDALVVRGRQTFRDLARELDGFRAAVAAAASRRAGLALEQLADDVGCAVVGADVGRPGCSGD